MERLWESPCLESRGHEVPVVVVKAFLPTPSSLSSRCFRLPIGQVGILALGPGGSLAAFVRASGDSVCSGRRPQGPSLHKSLGGVPAWALG